MGLLFYWGENNFIYLLMGLLGELGISVLISSFRVCYIWEKFKDLCIFLLLNFVSYFRIEFLVNELLPVFFESPDCPSNEVTMFLLWTSR